MANVMPLTAGRPATEVSEKARRRRFSAADKSRILRDADACTKPGELGALLRREGIYSSQLSKWRKRMKGGALAALAPKKRGPEARVVDARDREIAELQRQLSHATKRAERAEALVEIQKKFHSFWGLPFRRAKSRSHESGHRRRTDSWRVVHLHGVRRGAPDLLPKTCTGPWSETKEAVATKTAGR